MDIHLLALEQHDYLEGYSPDYPVAEFAIVVGILVAIALASWFGLRRVIRRSSSS
jgi:hypothetical protein